MNPDPTIETPPAAPTPVPGGYAASSRIWSSETSNSMLSSGLSGVILTRTTCLVCLAARLPRSSSRIASTGGPMPVVTWTRRPTLNQSANLGLGAISVCDMTVFTVSPGSGVQERLNAVGEDSVEGFGQAVQRTAPGAAGGECDLARAQAGAVALDVVVGDRVAPGVELYELALAGRVARV